MDIKKRVLIVMHVQKIVWNVKTKEKRVQGVKMIMLKLLKGCV